MIDEQKFEKGKFLKVTDNNQIFRNDLIFIHYYSCKISAYIIECIIFTPYDFLQWTLYNYHLLFTALTYTYAEHSIMVEQWCCDAGFPGSNLQCLY